MNSERRNALIILLMLTVFLVFESFRMSVFEDEALIVMVAARDRVAATMHDFLTAPATRSHPPLYDLLLRGWILATGGARHLLRVPSIALYALGLWLLADVAAAGGTPRHRAMLLLALWPAGALVAVPAHWCSLAFLAISGTTWAWRRWCEGRQRRDLAACIAFAAALMATSYFGILIFVVLVAGTLLTRPSRKLAKISAIVLVLALTAISLFAPRMIQATHAGTVVQPGVRSRLAEATLDLYALVAGVSVAPWTALSLPVFAGAAGLITAAVRSRRMTLSTALFLSIYVAAASLGILSTKRLALFAPWFLLAVLEQVHAARDRRLVTASLLLVGVAAWLGILWPRWPITYRYTEPWAEVADETTTRSAPGDLVIASHPSFYFYGREAFGWQDWPDPYVRDIVDRSGRTFAPVWRWRDALPGHHDVVYIRSVLAPHLSVEERDFLQYMAHAATETVHERYQQDGSFGLKNLFMGNQPEWRIELIRYRLSSSAPPVQPELSE